MSRVKEGGESKEGLADKPPHAGEKKQEGLLAAKGKIRSKKGD